MNDIKLNQMNDTKPNQHHHVDRPPLGLMVRSLVSSFVGIGALAAVLQFGIGDLDLNLMIGAFGASAVLVFGVPFSPLAQPYNLVLGHLISAAIGVAVFQIIGEANWLSAALAVSLAVVAMQATRSTHPPGGATALIAVVASPEIHTLGFSYMLFPVGLGVAVLLGVALIINNLFADQPWPLFWK